LEDFEAGRTIRGAFHFIPFRAEQAVKSFLYSSIVFDDENGTHIASIVILLYFLFAGKCLRRE
jgi:hypothetical protein